MSDRDLAISVRGLSKSYTIAHNAPKHTTMVEAFVHTFKKNGRAKLEAETFWALQDIEFDVKKGDVVGIIGRNGAGKSTLLKILSRITEPTTGQIDVYGRIGSLLEVGTGFHPELTGRENIFMNGSILGMSKRVIDKNFDAIVDFSGTEQFLDTPVKRYSSGMYVRLAFAVAAHLNPEILIVDEVLAVGDAEFQKKCLGKMQDVSRQEGRTILFVSHNIVAIRNLCRSCLYLRSGQILGDGPTEEIVSQYLSAAGAPGQETLVSRGDRSGTGEVRATQIRILDRYGVEVSSVQPNQSFQVEVSFESRCRLNDLEISIDVDSLDGYRVATLYSGFHNKSLQLDEGRGSAICDVAGLNITPDRYVLSINLGSPRGHYDLVQSVATLEVEEVDVFNSGRIPSRKHGAMLVNFEWRIDEQIAKEHHVTSQ